MINTHTTAVTYAALIAAAELATVAGDETSAVKWQTAANDIQTAAHKYLFNEGRGVFYRGVRVENGAVAYDATIDSAAVFGVFMFGLFAADSPEMKQSISTLLETFGVSTEQPGIPRYENDEYRRSKPDVQGNWWYITTLWKAQYDIENGQFDSAKSALDWINNHTLSTGMMGEQIDPHTHEIVAPAPLTWTHAEYLGTLIDLIGRER